MPVRLLPRGRRRAARRPRPRPARLLLRRPQPQGIFSSLPLPPRAEPVRPLQGTDQLAGLSKFEPRLTNFAYFSVLIGSARGGRRRQGTRCPPCSCAKGSIFSPSVFVFLLLEPFNPLLGSDAAMRSFGVRFSFPQMSSEAFKVVLLESVHQHSTAHMRRRGRLLRVPARCRRRSPDPPPTASPLPVTRSLPRSSRVQGPNRRLRQ